MKKWKQLIVSFMMVLGLGLTILPSPSASAINVFQGCSGSASTVCKSQGDEAGSMIKIVINVLLMVLGMISVIMVVIGGIRYTTSNGDSSSLKAAKETIIYAVVGLIIAIMSYTIVNFVVSFF